MANATPHSIEQHRRPKNVSAYEIDKHSSPDPPIIFRHRSSHLSKCPSISSSSTLSTTNSTTSSSSSSSLSSSNYLQQNHMFNKNIITNNTTNPLTSSPPISFPSRIPFSWEKVPGIPKHQKQDSKKRLPLPPGADGQKSCNNEAYSSKRYSICSSEEMMGSFHEDPFFMAMMECSKEKNRRETTKMVSTRRSFSSIVTSHLNIYGSCKSSSCSVSKSSIVRLPSTSTYTQTLFGLVRGRGRGRSLSCGRASN